MKVKEFCSKDYKVHRFYCACGCAEHVLDIIVEDGQIELQYFSGSNGCGRSLWQKLKMAFNLIFNRIQKLSWCEFVIRPEDKEEISKLIGEKKDGP